MQLTIQINEELFQTEIDSINEQAKLRYNQEKTRFDKIVAQTPESKRASLPVPVEPTEIEISDFVQNHINSLQTGFEVKQKEVHLKELAKLSVSELATLQKAQAEVPN